jgi:hypothetical protein
MKVEVEIDLGIKIEIVEIERNRLLPFWKKLSTVKLRITQKDELLKEVVCYVGDTVHII